MKKKIVRREFIKSSFIHTSAGLIALNELISADLLARGVKVIPAAEWPLDDSFCSIEPPFTYSRTLTPIKLTYRAGRNGLPLGWALMIRSISRIETKHNLTVLSSDPQFNPQVEIKNNVGIPRVIWIEPDLHPLPPGETITVLLEDYTYPYIVARCGFAVCEVDPSGAQPEIGSQLTFLEVPTLGGACLPKQTGSFCAVLPTRAQVNRPIRIRVAALDIDDLGTPFYTGTVSLYTDFPFLDLPSTISFTPEDEGSRVIEATPAAQGIIRIVVQDGDLTGESNPCVCTNEPIENQVYWGEYHKHSYHCDGHLEPEEHYRYARHYAFLDWGMLSTHDMWPSPRRGGRNWPLIMAATEEANEPGEFVTFQGYEWTHNNPFSPDDATGHKVIFFLDPDHLLPLIPFCYKPQESNPEYMPHTTLMDLLVKRAGNDVIVIPHHLPLYKWWVFPKVFAIEMGGPLPAMTREEVDALQPVAEVFSKVHGQNESWELQNWIQPPTAFFELPILHTFWLDGLKQGVRCGAVCAGDNHYRPMGQPAHTAMAAVMSPELTREGIFRAIQQRRTYGTSGPRIFIHFTVNHAEMGEIINSTGPWTAPRIEAALVSPLPIDLVEIVKVLPGEDEVSYTYQPSEGAMDCYFTWIDQSPAPVDWVCYYLRIHMGGDTEGAWTSPVWIEV